MRRLMIGAVVLATAMSCSQKGVKMVKGGKAPGKTVVVDNSGDVGLYVSMDIDVNDRVHMVYYDQKNKQLKYVKQAEAGFASEVVDDACQQCLYACITVTGNAEPHLAYYSSATQTLTYAYRKDGRWKKEPIEWGRGTGMGVRILFDEGNALHALYYAGDGYLKHAWRILRKDAPAKVPLRGKKAGKNSVAQELTEGVWGSERIDKANGSEKVQISFVRGPQGGLATSYLHWSGLSSELRVAFKQKDGDWESQIVAREQNPGKSSALFFLGGKPQLLFREALKNRLAQATRADEQWQITPLVKGAHNLSLATEAAGDLLLAFGALSGRDPRKAHLECAVRRSDTWTRYLVDSTAGTGIHLDAALTTQGSMLIAYRDEKARSLKLFIGD